MSYRVLGQGLAAIDQAEPDLGRAAYTASKMSDNGVKNVRVIDSDGQQIPRRDLVRALRNWS